MHDHYLVRSQLGQLSNEDLIELGGALGLYYTHLRKMSPVLDEMVKAWLNREDGVDGEPSWASLIKALRDIHKAGTATDIEKGK